MVTAVMRGSRQTRSRTGIPPLPTPTWKRAVMGRSLGFGNRPVAGVVPDLVAGEPAPRRLDREDARELGGVPAARLPGAALLPQTHGLSGEQMRTVLDRRDDPRLGGRGRVARIET